MEGHVIAALFKQFIELAAERLVLHLNNKVIVLLMRYCLYKILYVVGYCKLSCRFVGLIHIANIVAAVEVDIAAADSKNISL